MYCNNHQVVTNGSLSLYGPPSLGENNPTSNLQKIGSILGNLNFQCQIKLNAFWSQSLMHYIILQNEGTIF